MYLRAVAGGTCSGVAVALLAGLVACDKSIPAAPTPVPCAYSLSSQSQSFTAEGGPGSLTVSTDARCSWTVANATGWVTLLSAATGVGPGSVSFTVLANPDEAAREKRLTIAGLPFAITQDGRLPCAFAIAPEQMRFSDEGGRAEVLVTSASGCAWIASSRVSWIAVTAGSQGQGPGRVEYTVAPNNANAGRTGTVAIANRTFTVDQDGEQAPPPVNCVYAVTPVDLAPCMAGGTFTASVTTMPGCTWTSEPDAAWLQVPSGRSGSGSGTITITFTDNYDAPRTGRILVRWPTPTAGQNIRVAQAGCLYAVSQSAFSYAAGGGVGTFNVMQQSDPIVCGGPTQDRCVWTARSTVSWISVTTSMPRSGDSPVSFTVAAYSGSGSRAGTVTVRDKVVTITQTGS